MAYLPVYPQPQRWVSCAPVRQPAYPPVRPSTPVVARAYTHHPDVIGITQPNTIFFRMDEIDASAKATNASVTLNLAPSEYTQRWADWYKGWQKFYDINHSYWNLVDPTAWLLRSDALARENEAKAAQLNELRAEYGQQLSKQGGRPPPLSGPSVPTLPSGTEPQIPFTTIAITIGVVTLGVLAIVYAPEVKALFAAKKAAKR